MAGRGIVRPPARLSAEGLDLQRMQALLAGPEMDTRIWVARGVADDDAFKDEDSGLWFVPIILEPWGIGPVNVRLKPVGGVFWCPVKQGDELNVELPEGNPNSGPSCEPKLSNLNFLPPAGWDNDSFALISTDLPVRIVADDVSMGAPVDSDNPGKNEAPSDAQALGTTLVDALNNLATALNNFSTSANTLAEAGVSGVVPTTGVGVLTGAAAFGIAVQAFQQAIQQFTSGTYLSNSATVGK